MQGTDFDLLQTSGEQVAVNAERWGLLYGLFKAPRGPIVLGPESFVEHPMASLPTSSPSAIAPWRSSRPRTRLTPSSRGFAALGLASQESASCPIPPYRLHSSVYPGTSPVPGDSRYRIIRRMAPADLEQLLQHTLRAVFKEMHRCSTQPRSGRVAEVRLPAETASQAARAPGT
ncbi:hypothetical protein DYH09_35850 [bacterium CPR1]|nr:hypothetical protein [bacterium CPR1]